MNINILGANKDLVARLFHETRHDHQIVRATVYAGMLHRGQVRNNFDGTTTPYIDHPIRVALKLIEWGDGSPATIISGLLHDTLEDCPERISNTCKNETPEEWLTRNFGTNATQPILEVTNPGLKYQSWINWITKQSDQAVLVKAADLIDNAGGLPPKADRDPRANRLANKYRGALKAIWDESDWRGFEVTANELAALAARLDED